MAQDTNAGAPRVGMGTKSCSIMVALRQKTALTVALPWETVLVALSTPLRIYKPRDYQRQNQ